jgi:hypothetical protein
MPAFVGLLSLFSGFWNHHHRVRQRASLNARNSKQLSNFVSRCRRLNDGSFGQIVAKQLGASIALPRVHQFSFPRGVLISPLWIE